MNSILTNIQQWAFHFGKQEHVRWTKCRSLRTCRGGIQRSFHGCQARRLNGVWCRSCGLLWKLIESSLGGFQRMQRRLRLASRRWWRGKGFCPGSDVLQAGQWRQPLQRKRKGLTSWSSSRRLLEAYWLTYWQLRLLLSSLKVACHSTW